MPYIIETINSIVEQTYCPKEIVIVDDGSTDNTKEYIKAISENSEIPIKLYSNVENKAQYK